MNFLSVISLICLVAYTNQCQSGYRQIVAGDTYYNLGGGWAGACAYLNANPGVDPCNLSIGDCIRTPIAGSTSSVCPPAGTDPFLNNLYYGSNGSNGCFKDLNLNSNYYGSGYYAGSYTGYYNCPAGYYQIQPGNTFSALSNYNSAGTCGWINANPNVNPCNLQIGQCVRTPVYGYTSTQCGSSSCFGGNWGTGTYNGPYYGCPAGFYQIQSGDTFLGLSRNDWGGACAWINANPGVNPCDLRVGQCVAIPPVGISTQCAASTATSYGYCGYGGYANAGYYWGTGSYIGNTNGYACNGSSNQRSIVAGTTYNGLAGNTGYPACAWLAANPGVNPCNLTIGLCLNVPTGYSYNPNCVLC